MQTLTRPKSIIDSVLSPRSVAVIGASDDAVRLNSAPVRNLIDYGFPGKIYPVNPRKSEVFGLKCYASVGDLPEVPDTAVIVVRAEMALDALEQCAKIGVPSATLIAAGFVEGAAGEAGARLGERLHRILSDYPIRIVGPNTAGLQNLHARYVPRAAINQFRPEDCRPGSTAIICQSGAVSNILFNKCQAEQVGVSFSVATGSQVDLNVSDFLEHAVNDPDTRCILSVIEGPGDARRLIRALAFAGEVRKPVILLKLGRTDEGARMVQTHSGALAGSYDVFQSLLGRCNVLEPSDFDEAIELASFFQSWGIPPEPDNIGKATLGVISLSGGDGAFIADQVSDTSLSLEDTTQKFNDVVSSQSRMASGGNPFDPTAEVISNPNSLSNSVDAFVNMNSFDYHLFAAPVFGPVLIPVFCPALADVATAQGDKKFAISMWTAGELTADGIKILRRAGVPLVYNSRRAVRCIDQYNRWSRRTSDSPELLFPASDRADPFYFDLRGELADAGLTFAPGVKIPSVEEIGKAGFNTASPAKVVKMNVRSGVHKAGLGLVRLGVSNATELEKAIAGMRADIEHDGFVVEDMVHADLELILGGTTDADFGKAILLGFGGRLAEALDTTSIFAGSFRPGGLTAWVEGSQVGRVTSRLPTKLKTQLLQTVEAAASWFMAQPDVRAFDINPIRLDIQNECLWAADCRIQ